MKATKNREQKSGYRREVKKRRKNKRENKLVEISQEEKKNAKKELHAQNPEWSEANPELFTFSVSSSCS